MIFLAHQVGHTVTTSSFVAAVTPAGIPVGDIRWAGAWNNTLGNWRWIVIPRLLRA